MADRKPIILGADGYPAEIPAGDVLVAPAFAGDGSRIYGVQAAARGLSSVCVLKEDFLGGNLTSGGVGENGWLLGGVGTTTQAVLGGELDHPGILRRGTGATSTNAAITALKNSTSTGDLTSPLAMSSEFDLSWYARTPNVGVSTTIRLGLATGHASAAPGSGLYIEKSVNGSIWFGSLKNSSTITSTASLGATTANAWYRFRIRRGMLNGVDTVLFSVNGGTELTLDASLINTAQPYAPWSMIYTGEAVTKLLDLDGFEMEWGVTR